jgi:hypothetical protein
MSREHVWPIWLINHANVIKEGVSWIPGRRIDPRQATLPLCVNCNNSLGAELEEPVSRILQRVEAGDGLTDTEAEKLIRWLWKFEGLFVSYAHAGIHDWRYSDRWTLIERVLGNAINNIRGNLTLSVGLIHRNDDDYNDWPMGLDTDVGGLDGIFVSGVFGKTAMMVGLSIFDDLVPACLEKHKLRQTASTDDDPRFFPPICFPRSGDAISMMVEASAALKGAHEAHARDQLSLERFVTSRPRVEIPG